MFENILLAVDGSEHALDAARVASNLANSMNSLRIEGQKTVGIEIIQQFDWAAPDVIIIPGGNLGNVSALGNGLLMLRDLGVINRLPRIVVAQAERANPLYRYYKSGFENFEPIVAQQTLASAIQIGNPVSVKRAIRTLQRFNGVVEQATEQELADEAARADRTGMFNCPHTGVALAALRKLVERKIIRSGERVVVISTANGLKFADQKAAYHMGALEGIRPSHRNKPVELPADPRVRDLRVTPHRLEDYDDLAKRDDDDSEICSSGTFTCTSPRRNSSDSISTELRSNSWRSQASCCGDPLRLKSRRR